MNLRALRAFEAVVRHNGFSAAARAVAATQSTVSKAVQQLEAELGGALLVRLAQGVRLTPLGEAALRHARAMLAEQDALFAERDALRGLETGALRFGLPTFGSARLFAPLVAAYRRRYPAIAMTLREEGSRTLQQLVFDGELDLAVALQPLPDGLMWLEVRDEPVVALLPEGDPLARRERLSLAELAARAFILFEPGFALNDIVLAACRRRGFTPQEAARSGQADFIMALVAGGLGLGLLPRLLAEPPLPGGIRAVLVDEPDLRWRAGLIWRPDPPLAPPARAWVDLVRARLPL